VAEAERTLDFGQPVALMLLAVLQFALDEQDSVRGWSPGCFSTLPSGRLPGDLAPKPTDFQPQQGRVHEGVQRGARFEQAVVRDKADTARFFDPPGPSLTPGGGPRSRAGARTPTLTAARPSSIVGAGGSAQTMRERPFSAGEESVQVGNWRRVAQAARSTGTGTWPGRRGFPSPTCLPCLSGQAHRAWTPAPAYQLQIRVRARQGTAAGRVPHRRGRQRRPGFWDQAPPLPPFQAHRRP